MGGLSSRYALMPVNASEMQYARPPAPPSERGAWLLAGGLVLVGAVALTLALSGLLEGSHAAPPPIVLRVATPAPAGAGTAPASASGTVSGGRVTGSQEAIVQQPSASEQAQDPRRFAALTRVHISRRWMEGFYPIYATAQSAFAVNWLLLASIHKQESAFSTAPGIYHGLNFAHCCAGPMQFNVTNGPVSTWDLMRDSYLYGKRPASYDHPTAKHPSVYDDFDSIMAAAHLLSADGAGAGLEGAAWDAAYDYYGHDATGVLYADQVLARAIGWSQHGFCINCGLEENLVQAVHAAYGAPVLAALIAEEQAQRAAAEAKRAAARARRRAAARARRRTPARASGHTGVGNGHTGVGNAVSGG
jgi:hypothetical protein